MDVRMIAHDMRTPLTALLLSLEAAKHLPHSEAQEHIEIARRNALAVSQMIETLLATSEHGPWSKGPLVFRQNCAHDLIESAIDQVAPLAAKKSQKLESGELEELPPLVADGPRIIRVLVNLLSNAIKFTPEGGHIWIGARHRVNDGHPTMVFSVKDDGPGVRPEDIDRIFDTGVSVAAKGFYSSGLGLTVCREIVEAHGGRIWVETGVTEGATFSFAIPMGIVPTA